MKKILCLVVLMMSIVAVSAQSEHAKLHPNLEKFLGDDDSVRVLVQFTEKPGKSENALLKGSSCIVEYVPKHLNLIVADCPGNKLSALANAGIVEFVWEDEVLQPALDVSAPQIDATVAWASGYNGSGVIVSVIDTGVNTSHPAFANQFIAEMDFTTENSPDDFCNHGTHVATAVASINSTYKGIAHGAKFFNAKAGKKLSTGQQCGFSTTDVIEATDWSITNGAQVITMSIGSPQANCSLSLIANYVNQTVAADNIPIVIGAGNGGPGNTSIWSPGCAENVITVGAVNDNNGIASFSSRGPIAEDGRIKPDVVAPGVDIFSANNDGFSFGNADGTSMSTPHAAGVVALMLQANSGLSQGQVKSILKDTAVDLGFAEIEQGAGLVNASAAVALALNTTPEVFPDFPGLIAYYTSNAPADAPKYRDLFDNNTFSQELNGLNIGGDLVWVKAVSSPVDNETVLVTLDSQSDINVQVQTYDVFGHKKELTGDAGGFGERRFDAAYEQNSGRALVVYAVNSAVPSYEIWNGLGYSASGVLAADDCTGKVTWIAMASKPNSNELIAMYADDTGQYCAQVWNGSAWGNVNSFGTDSGVSTQKFDIAYEQSSGHALAVFETSTAGVIGYCEWDGSSWCSSSSTLSDRGGQNDWVKLASQRGSDRILLGVLQLAQSDRDVDVIEWAGASFGTWAQIDGKVENGAGISRMLDVAYIGTSGKGLVVYGDENPNVPSFAACASASDCFAGTWSSVATTTSSSNDCGESSDLDYVGLVEDPTSDKVLLYGISQANRYKCVQIHDGTDWGAWNSNVGSGGVSSDGEDVAAVYDLV